MENLGFSRSFLYLKKSGNFHKVLLGFGVFFTKSSSDNFISLEHIRRTLWDNWDGSQGFFL